MGFVKRTSFLSPQAKDMYNRYYAAEMKCHDWEMAHRGPRDESYHKNLIANAKELGTEFQKIDNNDEHLKSLGQLPTDKAEKKSYASSPLGLQKQTVTAGNSLETENTLAQNRNEINPNVLFSSAPKAFNPNPRLGNVMDFMC